MIFDTADPAQKMAFITECMAQELLYGNVYLMRASGGLILLLKMWVNPAGAS